MFMTALRGLLQVYVAGIVVGFVAFLILVPGITVVEALLDALAWPATVLDMLEGR